MDYKLIGRLAEVGYAFAPCCDGMTRSTLTRWPDLATSNKETIKQWLKDGKSLVSVAKRGHQYIIDIDDPIEAYNRGLKMEWLNGMFIVDTPSGGIHASGLHDAISDALPHTCINVRVEKDNFKSPLIVELKLSRASTAAPSAERFGVKGKKNGIYQPRAPFAGTVTGIHPDLLEWVKTNMDDKAPATMHASFHGFHPDFDKDEFLENECCSEFASGMVDRTYHVVVDECPLCGKPAVNSTLRAGITKFIFGGIGVGFICHACGIDTYKEYVEEMNNRYTDYEKWPKEKYIYKLDDPTILFADVEELKDEPEPEPVVEEEPDENIYNPDTKELEWLGVSTDEDDFTYTFYAQPMSDIEMEEMTWLWPEKIPSGMVTIISGKPDGGKTLCLVDWAARVSTGSDWPDGSKNTEGPKKVLLCSAEDDPARTMRPRLIAAGADLTKIINLKITVRAKDSKNESTGHLNVKRDLLMIAKIIRQNPDIAVLILDPITSYLGGANINKDEEIRPLMDKLVRLTQKTGLAVLALVHSNKRSDVDAVEKVMGASSVAGAARAVWTLAKDPDDPTLYRMGLAKGNVIKKRGGFEYRIVDAEVDIKGKKVIHPKIQWGAETNVDANDMLRADRQKARGGDGDSVLTLAKAVLRETVPGFATDAFKKAEAEGVNERAIYRAKKELGIESDKRGGKTFWYFPGQKGDPAMKPTVAESTIPDDVAS